ncbi:uncharacterized protein LAESUDRAFT_715551 [Laetiporus sulphureus 93-53]|uniref:DUF6593 domain-containing protein n=1 Tax=Laetiporus sulphureus 93-53 TaxID=1314785 RepID=A0A165DBT1_9APHY|nr:uncharacterized protein LAESUDRAFT_715551 [Laetiporus sulphureus 93-53]KZT04507.1 hypothetical protein LAESUDRAFT_715551 [Laetiporus sulphureus 93-53]
MNTNPFSQSGWQAGGAPSIFGALPSVPISSTMPRSIQPDSSSFKFVNFNTTILNCTVLGPQDRVTYRVVTDTGAPASTMWKDNENRNVAMVYWQPYASVEIRTATAKQRARDWLRLSADKSQRIMKCNGAQYAWSPIDGFICLHKVQSTAPRVLARIARAQSMVLLEMTPEAMQLGLLEPAIVATVLFICGHNID